MLSTEPTWHSGSFRWLSAKPNQYCYCVNWAALGRPVEGSDILKYDDNGYCGNYLVLTCDDRIARVFERDTFDLNIVKTTESVDMVLSEASEIATSDYAQYDENVIATVSFSAGTEVSLPAMMRFTGQSKVADDIASLMDDIENGRASFF